MLKISLLSAFTGHRMEAWRAEVPSISMFTLPDPIKGQREREKTHRASDSRGGETA